MKTIDGNFGPKEPGNYPLVTVTYDPGTGSPASLSQCILVNQSEAFVWLAPTLADDPHLGRGIAIPTHRLIDILFISMLEIGPEDFDDAN